MKVHVAARNHLCYDEIKNGGTFHGNQNHL